MEGIFKNWKEVICQINKREMRKFIFNNIGCVNQETLGDWYEYLDEYSKFIAEELEGEELKNITVNLTFTIEEDLDAYVDVVFVPSISDNILFLSPIITKVEDFDEY